MNRFFIEHGSPKQRSSARCDRMILQVLSELTREAEVRNIHVSSIFRATDRCAVGLAKPRCRFDKRVENGLQVERRAADNLKHVGGGRLLLKRLPQFAEQACVLDGDDCLGSEVR